MALTAKKVYAILKRQISDMEAKLNSPVRYRGTVATADLLPLNPDIGDMYNIESKSVYGEAGMNVAWNGVVWDTMGAPIDMSLYLTKEEAETVIQRLVTEYFEKNPVKPGVTTEQAQQIEQNKTDIASLKTETGSLKEDIAYNQLVNYYDSSAFTNHGFIKVDGSFVQNDTWFSTDYIECGGCKAIKAKLNYYSGLIATIAFFDKNKKFISYLEPTTLDETVYTDIPQNAYYVIFSSQVPDGNVRWAYIYRIHDVYSSAIAERVSEDLILLNNKVNDLYVSTNAESYEFNHAEIITPNGNVSSDSNYSRTDFIDLTNVPSFTCRLAHNEYVSNVAYFDENKSFISKIDASSDSSVFKITSDNYPSGARFVVFTTANSFITSFVNVERTKYVRQVVKIEKGYYKSNGDFVESNDMSHTAIKVEPGEKYHVIGCTYGGTIALITYYKNNVYVSNKFIGSAGTLIYRNAYIEIPNDVDEMRISFANNCIDNGQFLVEKYIPNLNGLSKLYGKKVATLGDSITADDYCKIGTIIQNILGVYRVGNFAVGGSTCADAQNGSDIDLVNTTSSEIGNNDVNVLSNQVRRLLAHTTKAGQQIKWTHALDGAFSIPTEKGTGIGIEEDVPDIVYIAISVNDGGERTGTIVDDCETVFEQSYKDLTKKSIASGLRWAIETLRSAYPNVQIFVATPLWTGSNYVYAQYSSQKLKAEIIKKVANFCSVKVIDSQSESGFTKVDALSGADSVYIHPDKKYRWNIGKYVANEIENKYSELGTESQNGIIN